MGKKKHKKLKGKKTQHQAVSGEKPKEKKHVTHKTVEPEKKEVDELREIYSDKDGELPDMTQLDRLQKSRLTRWLIRTIVVLVIIVAAAWGGFFFITRGFFNTTQPLSSQIDGPDSVFSGDEATYTIRYTNNGKTPIAALEVRASLPPGFELISSSPKETEENTWITGSLSPNSDGAIILKGKFRSAVPSSASMQVFFTYRPANFNSEFQDIQTTVINITESVLDIEVSGPEKALAGDEISYVIEMKNDSDLPAESVRITANIPKDFVVSKTEPKSNSEDSLYWDMIEVLAAETEEITITGSYTSSAKAEQLITVEALFVENVGIKLLQSKDEVSTDVLGGELEFHLIVDGGADNITANIGDNLRISIDYENKGNEAIEDVAFTLDLTDEKGRILPIDWEAANLPEELRRGNRLIWNKDIIPELTTINPGDINIIDLTLPLLDEINPANTADKFEIALSATLQKVGSISGERSIEASPITVAINSELRAISEARYFDEAGDVLGSGPLPPIVGQATTYHILFSLDSTIHDVENVQMTTNLPPDVAWTGKTEASSGEVEFDYTTRLITWEAGSLKATEGAEAWFEVMISPEDHDANAFFKLTNATLAEA